MRIDFHASPEPTLGVEWELAIVDRDTRDLVKPPPSLLADLAGGRLEHPERLHKELLRNTVEVVSGICDDGGRGRGRPHRHPRRGDDRGRRAGRRPDGCRGAPLRRLVRAAADRGPPLRRADRPHPVVGPPDAHLGRARPRRDARARPGHAGPVLDAHDLSPPARPVRELAGVGRAGHRLRLQPGADVPAAADGRAAVRLRHLGRRSRPASATRPRPGSSTRCPTSGGTSAPRRTSAPSSTGSATASPTYASSAP